MSKHPFQDLIIEGSKAPIGEVKNNIKVTFSEAIMDDYIPTWNKIEAPRGIKLLALIMAQKEGFIDNPGTKNDSRSFKFNNPGNIGNTDSGANQGFKDLATGIQYQFDFLIGIAKGTNKNFKIGRKINWKPYYSPEIAKNQKTYQLEPWCPGYKFIYSGKLSEFIKIYSTGARQKNTYLSLIISYFKNMGYDINENTTLQQILELK